MGLLERYVDSAIAGATPDDVDSDPQGLVGWEEAGREIAKASTAPQVPWTQGDFEAWLVALAMTFKTAVEGKGLSRVLWNDDHTQHL